MLSSLLTGLFVGIAVFVSLELHRKLERVRQDYGGKLTFENLRQIADAFTATAEDQRPEFMLPMDDAEYEEHMLDQSGRGELLKKVLNKMPWRSKAKTSQSSDT